MGKLKGNKDLIFIIYETLMLGLIILSLVTVFVSDDPHPIFSIINRVVWVVFLVDVGVRIIKAVSRWNYIKKNPFDIISIIPFEDWFLIFRVFRVARLIKLFRYKNLIKRYLLKLDGSVQGYSTLSISWVTASILLLVVGIVSFDLTIKESFIWVLRNFIQFNYVSSMTEGVVYTLLSIVLKVYGVLYMGLVLNRIGKFVYQKYKFSKRVED